MSELENKDIILESKNEDLKFENEDLKPEEKIKKQTIDMTPLAFAATKGRVDIVSFLIESGADVNGKNSFGQTALMFACMYGHKDVVEFLVEKGADIDVKDAGGLTAVMYAMSTRSECMIPPQEKKSDENEVLNE